jgi:hypothetical protein
VSASLIVRRKYSDPSRSRSSPEGLVGQDGRDRVDIRDADLQELAGDAEIIPAMALAGAAGFSLLMPELREGAIRLNLPSAQLPRGANGAQNARTLQGMMD